MRIHLLPAVCALSAAALAAPPRQVSSPDGKIRIAFSLQPGGQPAYRIDYAGNPVVLESRLGFPELRSGFTTVRSAVAEHRSRWINEFGERRDVPDVYRELNVDLKHESGVLLRISFRAYNEGAAFRYSFPAQAKKDFQFSGEATEFRLPPQTFGYEEHGTEGEYARVRVADIQPQCERPLTVEFASGTWASLAEADNQRYPRMLLSGLAGVPGALVSALGGSTSNGLRGGRDDGRVTLASGDSTPWRVFVLGRKPGDLLEQNYLLLNLNPPSALKDTSWIRPGKAMRDATLTTANAKAMVDLAPKLGIQYIGFDDRWYGGQDPETGDATTVRVPNLDIQEAVRYANSKGIGASIYIDRRQAKKQRDILFPLYEKWGVKAVKIGFVDVGPQSETAWITETLQKAAEHHLALDIHDGYRPTGNNRTYPNLLTVEGIRGNEHMPTPEHNATLPFTRFVAGLGDYTVCYFTPRKKTTFAHQLAMAVVAFSPMQWVYWYDKPSDFHDEPEIEFFRQVPTVWDETRVINAKVGEFATIARRKGDAWFIGTINDSHPRTLDIPLSFLAKGRKYVAHTYSDDDRVDTRTKVAVAAQPVDSAATLQTMLKAAGGQAIWIEPVAAPADAVNPLIGTAGDGQTFPATGVPFGMTHWTPQTRDGEAKCVAPYYEKDTRIQGFRGSHFLSGSCTQDYGSVTIMPSVGALKLSAADRASSFRRGAEISKPYRYDVTLDDSGIKASVAATSRAAILEFRYPAAPEAWVLVQANSRKGEGEVRIDVARREVSGYNPAHRLYAGAGQPAGFSGYFVARFDRPFRRMGVWSGTQSKDGAVVQPGVDGAPGAYLGFSTKDGDVIRVKVGTSFTSIEEARRNLDSEIPAWSLDEIAVRARDRWNEALSKIETPGASETRRRIFYTAFYHALLLPRAFSDVSGTYPGFAGSGKVETARGFTYYCDFSLWDTFRSEHPLLTIVDPERTRDMAQSLIAKGQQGGWMPIFPAWNSYTQEMIGDHAAAMIVDAYVKGIRGFDAEEAYRLMRQNAMETPASREAYIDGRGRRALASYLKYGYVPLEDPVKDAFHKGEQVSRTLEYAYDDWVLSRMAAALGKTADEKLFLDRARNYRNVIDPATGFARGRHADGSWATPFDPAGNYGYITEGLPFQYTFFVPQDVEGLIALTGGRAAFIEKLDRLFDGKHYNHGNEPSHHIAYLYDYAGAPWKTQQRVRQVIEEQYRDAAAGIAGNDDCGQMSAWHVMSALGFYSVAPGSPVYQIGSPLFDETVIHTAGPKPFIIRAPGAAAGRQYIQSATLNGKPITRTWISHSELVAGGELIFVMGSEPNKAWGARAADAPPSLTPASDPK